MIDKFFKYYILKNVDDIWYLFGIDLLRKKCYSIVIDENPSIKTEFFDIINGRKYWSELIKKGFNTTTLKKEGSLPSLLIQRLKEWNSLCFNQHNGWKNKKRVTDPWLNKPFESDKKDDLQFNREEGELSFNKKNVKQENNIYPPSANNNLEPIEEATEGGAKKKKLARQTRNKNTIKRPRKRT